MKLREIIKNRVTEAAERQRQAEIQVQLEEQARSIRISRLFFNHPEVAELVRKRSILQSKIPDWRLTVEGFYLRVMKFRSVKAAQLGSVVHVRSSFWSPRFLVKYSIEQGFVVVTPHNSQGCYNALRKLVLTDELPVSCEDCEVVVGQRAQDLFSGSRLLYIVNGANSDGGLPGVSLKVSLKKMYSIYGAQRRKAALKAKRAEMRAAKLAEASS